MYGSFLRAFWSIANENRYVNLGFVNYTDYFKTDELCSPNMK